MASRLYLTNDDDLWRADHLVVLDRTDDGKLTVSYQLNHYMSFFKRLVLAFDYIFGFDMYTTHWESVTLDRGRSIALNEFVKETFSSENLD